MRYLHVVICFLLVVVPVMSEETAHTVTRANAPRAAFETHVSATGNAVHGLGDISTHNATDFVTPIQLSDAVAQGSIYFAFTLIPDATAAGYYQLLTSPLSTLASSTSALLTDQGVWVAQTKWLSPIGSPGITRLRKGTYNASRYKTKSNGADAQVMAELWKFSTASVSTFIASSSFYSITDDGLENRCLIDFSLPSDIAFETTDRIELRGYARKSGPGADITITNWEGDGKPGYFSLPLEAAEVMRIDATNASITNLSIAGTFTHGIVWEDFVVSPIGVNLSGPPQAATVDTTEDFGALTYAGNAVNDAAFFIQLPHRYKNGSDVAPHFHCRAKSIAAEATATFEIHYAMATPMGNFPSAYSVATATVLVGTSTATHLLVTFPHISTAGMGDSTVIKAFLRRNGSTDPSNVDINVLSIDWHYQSVREGSHSENGDYE